MTAQHVAWLLLGLGSGLASGYPWGRWLGRRRLDRAYEAGYGEGHDDGWDARGEWEWDRERDDTLAIGSALAIVPRPESTGVTGRAEPERGPGRPDWREQVAADLAPEALALDVPDKVLDPDCAAGKHGSCVGGPCDCICHKEWIDAGYVPRPESAPIGQALRAPVLAGPGHPSPYAGPLTPAQRRRDKHKQRGQWAAVTYPEVGPPLLGPPSEWMAARIERWKHEMASIGESDWLARELTAVA